jgi:hypothetical protein
MKITTCVPLPGQGLVARSGSLIVLTDGVGGDPDPLLTILGEVAAAAGDGSALVRSVARAALACEDQPGWACLGVTSDGELAVLVQGSAAAEVTVDGGGNVTLAGRSSLLPVTQLLSGGTVSATVTLAGPTGTDSCMRLDGGIVRGGGVHVTATTYRTAPPVGGVGPCAPCSAMADPGVALPLLADPSRSLEDNGTGAREPRPSDSEADGHPDDPAHVLVDGVLCARQHFNDPNVRYCRRCGVGIESLAGNIQRRPRPTLGVLLVDDGAVFPLDSDYVLGREPMLDADVAAGRARALRISDQDGTVSRLHLRVSLVGWQVEVCDLGSANGPVLHPAASPDSRLQPHDPVIIEPGTRVVVGHRSFQYLSDRISRAIREH